MDKKILIGSIIAIVILILTSFIPVVGFQTTHLHSKISFSSPFNSRTQNAINEGLTVNERALGVQFIYNIAANLSDIIFDVYDEEHGEIAKGRAFGTKGEHRAAQIIYENMTKIGLHTTLEKLKNFPRRPNNEITHKLEVLDYCVKVNGKSIDCYPAPAWAGPRGNKNKLNTTFNYSGLKVKRTPKHPCIYNKTLAMETEDFVFIGKDQINDPNGTLPFIDLFKPFIDRLKFYMLFYLTTLLNIERQTAKWYKWYPHCKGLILYDFNDQCHDMVLFDKSLSNYLPTVYTNGTVGNKILNDIENHSIDLYLKQRYNTSVISYNVIGQLNGTDTTKTVILSSLYDSWWCQGTADSAIGMGIVLAIAKYYNDNNITPKYTMKFIAFSGEEYNMKGAKYYEELHCNESIIYMIDLNQVGFTQLEPRPTLNIVSNKLKFLNEIWEVSKRSNYVERTGNTTDIKKIWWPSGTIPSNPLPFGINRKNCKAVSFFKDGYWVLHHRDGPDEYGMKHMEGDVLKYFNWTDVSVTGELILNITKHLTLESNKSHFDSRFSPSDFKTLFIERVYQDLFKRLPSV
ncbi:MAG: M28 family peptidase [Thermoplasmatales archaeon]|nr:M28 family peptidase [Thermoplasmatales archaeon]